MKIKIIATLHKYDRTIQIIDTDKKINHLKTPWHPYKGEDIITELFLKALQDAKDVGVLKHFSFREVMRFYEIELAYYEEQRQYTRDFMF